MTVRQYSHRGSAGFSLIDAMIAVVVLATGILALTFLQTSMMRATAEARDRGEAATVVQNLMERYRANATQTVGGYSGLASEGLTGTACDLTSANAKKLANVLGAATANDYYRYCSKVTRYWACPSGSFTNDASICAAPASVGFTSEYKHVELTLGWRDAGGTTWHSLTLGDAISGIPLVNSNDLQNRPLTGNSVLGRPVVRYPGNFFADEANFIPIAVGDSSNTNIAATNPTPEVIGGGVAETSFQVFTYVSQGGAIEVQRQIDTKSVACKCRLEQAPSTPSALLQFSQRPSYWDGRRYTAPVNVKSQQSYLRGVAIGGSSESEYCDVCCRDHHDPAGFDYNGDDNADPLDDFPKVDPYTSHKHYLASVEASQVTDEYSEVCRVVRVDGIYRVTQDPAIEHFAYLPTDDDAKSPSTSVMAADPFPYNTFVRNFVEKRLNLKGSPTLSGYTPTGFMAALAVAGLEDATGVKLNAQTSSSIKISTQDINSPLADPARYLQNRAIVMDALEYPARKTIQDRINDPQNTACKTNPLPCVLQHVPFNSINLTPLTFWNTQWVKDGPAAGVTRALSDAQFTISPKDVLAPDASQIDVYAGQVGINPTPKGDPDKAPSTDSVLAAVSRTVTALVERFALFPTTTQAEIDQWRLGDSQAFTVTGDPPTGALFTVRPVGLTYLAERDFSNSSAPDVRWRSGTKSGVCRFVSASKDYACYVSDPALLSAITLEISNYHQKLTLKQNETVSCPNPLGGQAVKSGYPVKCSIWGATVVSQGAITSQVPAADYAASPNSNNPADDQIIVNLGAVTANQIINVTFTNINSALLPDRTTPQCNAASGIAQNWAFIACRLD